MPWKEQATSIQVPGEERVLEGVWQAGSEGGAVVAPPHPEYGGSLDNPVVNDLAYGLYQAGFASLRFNWRGVGGSQGAITGDFDVALADYRAALEHLAASVEGPVWGAGYSFGAATAIGVALGEPRIRRLILVAPPARMLERLPLAELARPLRVIAGGDDAIAAVDRLRALIDPLPDARLEVIEGADHFFASHGLADLVPLVRAAAE